ncbi:MAG: hypothetical protein HQ567_29805 [Candidatus Nealsonbacteria bacterium]|nr:hypothetical protein [Candidatus Nealsonbacteria bacterium]
MGKRSKKVLLGGLCGHLVGHPERQRLVDVTFEEVRRFHDSRSRIRCLRQLLGHLVQVGASSAAIAFIAKEGGVLEFVASEAGEESKESAEQIQEQLQQNGLRYTNNLSPGQANDIDKEPMKRLLGDSLAKEFKHAVVVKSKLVPALRDSDQSVVIFFVCRNLEPDRTFLRDWLQTLLSIWSDAFSAAVDAFQQCIERFAADGPKSPPASELFDRAHAAHPWLSSADVFRVCEALFAQEDVPAYGQIKKSVERFSKDWHCCPNRPWPCDRGGDGQHRAILTWLPWRMARGSGDRGRLRSAAKATRIAMKTSLVNPSGGPRQLDEDLSKIALLRVATALEKEKLRPPVDTTEAYQRAKEHLERFATSVLGDTAPTAESIEAVIWTISQYAYQALGVDRRLHLGSHMRHGARGEPSLHMMREFYRDHFFHTIEVCLLGNLLTAARPNSGPPKPAFACKEKHWYVAALLHDIGYAVDISKGLVDWLKFFSSGSLAAMAKGITGAMEDMGADKRFRKFYKQQGFQRKDKPWGDHGLIGARHLHTLARGPGKRQRIRGTKAAVRAIAKHNCQTIKIDYEKEPLSAMLVLCDLLQTWRRPQFPHFSMGPAWLLSLMAGTHARREPPQATRAKLLSNLVFEEEDDDAVPRFTPPLVLRLEYGQEVNCNSYVFNMWLDATCNLQRVDFQKLPFDIVVQIVTPTYRPPGEQTPKCQMDRLRDAAADTHMAYLLQKWFPKKLSVGVPQVDQTVDPCCINRAICYHVEYKDRDKREGPLEEMLSFSLCKMDGDRKWMSEGMGRFRADLRRWKLYQQDRSPIGDYAPLGYE